MPGAEMLHEPVRDFSVAPDVTTGDKFSLWAKNPSDLGDGALLVCKGMPSVHTEYLIDRGIFERQVGHIGPKEVDIF